MQNKTLYPIDKKEITQFYAEHGIDALPLQKPWKESPHTDYKKALTFDSAVEYLSSVCRQREELLVIKVSIAVTMSAPQLSATRMQHALFTKQLFLEGEITFESYIEKMKNLFPNRMENISRELQKQIATFLD